MQYFVIHLVKIYFDTYYTYIMFKIWMRKPEVQGFIIDLDLYNACTNKTKTTFPHVQK